MEARRPLHVLNLEDQENDAILVRRALEKEGFECRFQRVETREHFLARLSPELDVILADHALPRFNSTHALELLNERGLDIPFIIVSGIITEEAAVEALRQGATDFVLKDRLVRLGPAVRRALRDREVRREKQLAQAQLRASEALLSSVLNSSPDCIVAFRAQRNGQNRVADLEVILFNRRCGAGPELQTDIASGRQMLDRVAPDLYDAFVRVAETGEPYDREQFVDGTSFQGWIHITAVRLGDGVTATFRDVTGRKKAEEALRQSEERWRKLVENNPLPILISIGGRIKYVNPAGARLVKADAPSDLIGKSPAEFLGRESRSVLIQQQRRLDQGIPSTARHLKLVCLDGEERFVESFSVPVLYHGRKAVQTVVRDVTAQKAYEQGLIEAKEYAEEMSRLKSAFLANMSHEIRTPLTAILGFAELLADDPPPKHGEFVALIRKSGERLMETLRSVLDLAQLESGALRFSPEALDVVALVRNTAELYRSQVEDKGLELRLIVPDEPVRVWLDRLAFDRILTNLLNNAVKFTSAGRIVVCVETEETDVYVRVSDTGIGISTAFVSRIFEEFAQESSGLARSFEGSGLGLTITKRLVDMMGGTIAVQSTKGEGSTFTVRFPRLVEGYDRLTPREREVLHLVGQGLTSAQIAEKLFISERAVEKHRSNIVSKLGLEGPFGLLRFTVRHQPSSPPGRLRN